MNKNLLWKDIQTSTEEFKNIVNSFDENKESAITDLGNLSFLSALLQEKIENLIREIE